MSKFKYTLWFYAKDHFKKKSLIILGIFFLAPIVVFYAIDQFGGGNYPDIAIVQNSNSFVIAEEIFEGIPNYQFHMVDSEDEAHAMLDEGDVSEVYIIEGEERPELKVFTTQIMPDREIELFLTQVLTGFHLETMIDTYDLPIEVVAELTTPISVTSEVVNFENLIAAEVVNQLLPMLIMMIVAFSGQMVANSVTTEKTSRVMEVMLGKVSPTITMVTKVLSSFIGNLLPLIAIVLGVIVSGILGIVDFGDLSIFSEIFTMENLLLTLLVFILGYFCFVFFFAAAGAIATSIDSLNTVLTPLLVAFIIPAMLPTFIALDSFVMDILVYIPITSPFILVQRYIHGYSGLLEIGISIVIMIVFSIVSLIISARLYKNGVSHRSEKITYNDMKKLLQK